VLGIVALAPMDTSNAEVKSLRTEPEARGHGVGTALMNRLVAEARTRGFRHLWIETGTSEHYAPAQRLYERSGFTPTGPFANYTEDPNSYYMTRSL
jgi:putative acetyltransferase